MPDQFANFYYVKVSARAEIGGKQIPVSSFEVTYALDEIPTAELHFPLGRNAALSGQTSAAHGLLSGIVPFTPVKLFMTAKAEPKGRAAPPGPPPKDAGFSDKEMLVFEGFAGSPTVSKKSGGSASLDLKCFGVAGALAGTTRFSNGITVAHTGNGAEVVIVRLGSGEGSVRVLGDMFLKYPAELDVWEFGIEGLFSLAVTLTDAWFDSANSFARTALDRINDGKGDLPVLKLSLAPFAGTDGAFRKQLVRDLTETFYGMWAGSGPGADSDLWNALRAYIQSFLFHFVPAADTDAVVPLTFGLGGDPHRIIDPSEYTALVSQNKMGPEFYAYITSVGLFSSGSRFSDFQDGSARSFSLGRAVLPNLLSQAAGRFVLVPAPNWILPINASGAGSLHPGLGIPDAASLGVFAAPLSSQSETEAAPLTSGSGNAWAETALHEMAFKHRGMGISGRLRMDIAPGSLIRINTPGERFAGLGDSLFGHVTEVLIEVGNKGQDSFAKTSFSISHVRSETEHSKFTTDEHPLFGKAYRGGRLLRY